MAAVRVLTPLWVKLLLAVLVVGAPAWWLADRHDQLVNEARLEAVASAIAGRDVRVRCPGPFGRAFGYDIVEGSVRFGPDGRPADETQLREQACGELDALGDGRRAGLLECLERTGGTCGTQGTTLAAAVDVLSHESWHLHGVMNEAVTECRSLQTMGWTAAQLGASEAQGRALARVQLNFGYELLPDRYRSPDCHDGGPLDLHPDIALWP